MVKEWAVDDLDVELLLAGWRWLCPQEVEVVARNAFGDLFLSDETGSVYQLDIAGGALNKIAISVSEFCELSARSDKQEEWFAKNDEAVAAARGLQPDVSQCIAFNIPLCFAQSGAGNEPYIANLYKHLSFTGDIHRQMAHLPDRVTLKLVVRNIDVEQAGEPRRQVRD
jgi:hypothetical protein